MEQDYSSLGKEVRLDVNNCACSYDFLNNSDKLKQFLISAAEKARATVKMQDGKPSFHCAKFETVDGKHQGVSAYLTLMESHISIHTYPETKDAMINIFTCGNTADPELAVPYMLEVLKPEHHKLEVVKRGITKQDLEYD